MNFNRLISTIAVGIMVFFSQNVHANIWLTPSDQNVGANDYFDIEVHADTGGENLGAFNMFFDFDPFDVAIDFTGGSGFDKGVDTTSFFIMANPNDVANGHFRFAGITGFSYPANGNGVHLLTIHAQATSDFISLNSGLDLRVNEFANDLGYSIATGTITGASITNSAAPVPEPTTALLFSCGIAGLGFFHRKKRE